jgi:tRNA pseudouridine38-40 synthase
MSCNEIQRALNANLPEDIAVLNVTEVPLNFHARYSVKSKTYRYTILNRHARCAQQRNFCLFYPDRLNVRSMREAAKSFIGRKDFKSFTASDPAQSENARKNTVRSIELLTIAKKGDFLLIDIEADGFLYKMVRNIVGTLMAVGSGQLPRGDILRILSQKDRRAAGSTAKAKGLTLLKVQY